MPTTELNFQPGHKKTDRESNKYNIVTPAGCAWSKNSIFGATRVTSWVAWVCANYGGEPGIFISFSFRGKVGNLWQGRSMMDSSIGPDSSVGRSAHTVIERSFSPACYT